MVPIQRPRTRGPGHEADGEQPSAHQEGRLNHVGPDHGPNPSHHGVHGGDDSDHPDDHHQGQPRGHRQRSRGDQHDHSHEHGDEEEKHGGPQQPHREVVPVLQVLVGRRELEPDEEGDGQEQNQDHVDGNGHQVAQEGAEAEAPDDAGTGQVGDAGQERRDDADSHGEPGEPATAQKVLFFGLLPPGEPPAQEHHGRQVDDQHHVIGKVKLHQVTLSSAGSAKRSSRPRRRLRRD